MYIVACTIHEISVLEGWTNYNTHVLSFYSKQSSPMLPNWAHLRLTCWHNNDNMYTTGHWVVVTMFGHTHACTHDMRLLYEWEIPQSMYKSYNASHDEIFQAFPLLNYWKLQRREKAWENDVLVQVWGVDSTTALHMFMYMYTHLTSQFTNSLYTYIYDYSVYTCVHVRYVIHIIGWVSFYCKLRCIVGAYFLQFILVTVDLLPLHHNHDILVVQRRH